MKITATTEVNVNNSSTDTALDATVANDVANIPPGTLTPIASMVIAPITVIVPARENLIAVETTEGPSR
jgi:hypothetical protein